MVMLVHLMWANMFSFGLFFLLKPKAQWRCEVIRAERRQQADRLIVAIVINERRTSVIFWRVLLSAALT